MNDSILVINCGSSSLKFAILANAGQETLVEGIADRLGTDESNITFKFEGTKNTLTLEDGSHKNAVTHIKEWLNERPSIEQTLVGIGHRVVHGGETFGTSVLINQEVLDGIKECAQFAPLHNPAHAKGIEVAFELFPGLPQAAVFDTAFHQTLAPEQYLYPIPMHFYREHHFRKYGFHGTSYRYISQRLAQIVPGSDQQGVLVAHLGNGASTCAINKGQSSDTSMGITPLEGLMMGTRSGSLDPSLLSFISQAENISADAALDILNKKSGLLGVSEISNDCRTLEDAMMSGDQRAKLALDMFAARTAKHLASVATTLDSIDHLVFTGGIGENSGYLRQSICDHLKALNIRIDSNKNEQAPRGETLNIHSENSGTDVWIIPTNEELMIALDTISLIKH
ncbi:MAG: acetate/propionate family kinase [Marinomonas sp.]|jgi:acetate kinase|uniref:Acetate kinase n=1 Tax=Marinomonas pontica TaxID=264739 RepID=A0ABN6WMS5_9GAMM|nr:acetate kinase [Marinomonas pontica]MCW8355193.1 acetate kinase [Marinomonas pontica]BDX02928.1 acetate kinase [Marinomonas pontica]